MEPEEHEVDSLEEAGMLEADIGAKFDQQLAAIDPKLKINMDPKAHQYLRPEQMFIREELRQAKLQTLAVRRTALRKLLRQDFIQEDCELRNLGLAYARPGPETCRDTGGCLVRQLKDASTAKKAKNLNKPCRHPNLAVESVVI